MSDLAAYADELRFTDPAAAPRVSHAAVQALNRHPFSPEIQCTVWAIHGSVLRSIAELDEADRALTLAASFASTAHQQADVARRLATLRAEQSRSEEARALLPAFLKHAQAIGGRYYGKRLIGAAAVLMFISDFEHARDLAEHGLSLLPSGDRWHVAAVYNLCRCNVELASSADELEHAAQLARKTQALVREDDYTGTKFLLLLSHLHRKLGDSEGALEFLNNARASVEASGKALDQAILLVDMAWLHIELGAAAEAVGTILQSFPLLSELRKHPEAFRAITALHCVAANQSLDIAALSAARSVLQAKDEAGQMPHLDPI